MPPPRACEMVREGLGVWIATHMSGSTAGLVFPVRNSSHQGDWCTLLKGSALRGL